MAEHRPENKDEDGGNPEANKKDVDVYCKHKDVDGGWAWLVAIGMATFYFTIGGFFRSFGVVFAAIMEQFGQSAWLTSLVPGVRAVCLIIVAPASTALSQRLTERVILITGAVVVSTGFIISFFAKSLEFLIFSIGMLPGLGVSLIIGPANIMMGRYFHRRRARAITVTSSVGCVGQITVPLLMVYLIETYSVQGALLIYGGIILNVVVTGMIMKPINLQQSIADTESESDLRNAKNTALTPGEAKKDFIVKKSDENNGICHVVTEPLEGKHQQMSDTNGASREPLKTEDEKMTDSNGMELDVLPPKKASKSEILAMEVEPLTASSDPQNPHSSNVIVPKKTFLQAAIRFVREMYPFELLKNGEYSMLLVVSMMSLFMLVCQQNYLFVMAQSLGFSRDQSAWFLSVFGLADMVGRLSAGQLSDRKVLPPQYIMASASFASGLAFGFVPLATSIYALVPLIVVIGCFISVTLILMMPMLVETIGLTKFPRGFAMLLAFHGLMSTFTPTLLGLIKDFTGKYDAMFPLTGGFQICGGLLLVAQQIRRARAKKRKAANNNAPI